MNEVFWLRGTGLALAILGMWLLRKKSQSPQSSMWPLAVAWIAIFFSLTLWSLTSGIDKGAALGIIAVILAVIPFILATTLSTAPRQERSIPNRSPAPVTKARTVYLRNVWIGVLIGPLSGLAALALSTLVFGRLQTLGLDHSMNLAVVSIAFPTLWAALAVFAGFEPRLLHKSAWVIGAGMLPVIYLFIASSGV